MSSIFITTTFIYALILNSYIHLVAILNPSVDFLVYYFTHLSTICMCIVVMPCAPCLGSFISLWGEEP
jgi:hypothetical protein